MWVVLKFCDFHCDTIPNISVFLSRFRTVHSIQTHTHTDTHIFAFESIVCGESVRIKCTRMYNSSPHTRNKTRHRDRDRERKKRKRTHTRSSVNTIYERWSENELWMDCQPNMWRSICIHLGATESYCAKKSRQKTKSETKVKFNPPAAKLSNTTKCTDKCGHQPTKVGNKYEGDTFYWNIVWQTIHNIIVSVGSN